MQYPIIYLKKDREHVVGAKHPWIFSGALDPVRDIESGSVVRVCTHANECVGVGVYMREDMISVRMLAWEDAVINQEFVDHALERALRYRTLLGYGKGTDTTAYRLHFAESDTIPGLIVDIYGDVVVLQLHSIAAEVLREYIIDSLKRVLNPRAVIERSDSSHRMSEGFEKRDGIVSGECAEPVLCTEYGIEYLSFPLTGQKTGFFCDQKDLRAEIRAHAHGRSVLNLCSYTGAQSVAAMHGNAVRAHNIDISDAALAGCEAHRVHHGYSAEQFTTERADVFQWIGQQKVLPHNFVIFDPPALIKTQKEKESGMKAYHFLNRALLRAMQPGALFSTSSCSQFFTEEDMLHMLQKASLQVGKRFRIIRVVRQSPDHPQSLYFPQSTYLKSVIGLIE